MLRLLQLEKKRQRKRQERERKRAREKGKREGKRGDGGDIDDEGDRGDGDKRGERVQDGWKELPFGVKYFDKSVGTGPHVGDRER